VDGELNRAADLQERLTFLYRKIQPQVLVAQDPWKHYELHLDHRVAGMAAVDAQLSAKLAMYYPKQLSDDVSTCAIGTLLLFNSDEPNLWVDVTRTADRKFEALFAHRSQFYGSERQVREALTGELRENGKRIRTELAEAFKEIELEGTRRHIKIH
jgi:LmbE family N-acetylglucosaminyl deacetylase